MTEKSTAVAKTDPGAGDRTPITEREELNKTANLLQTSWGGSTQMTLEDFRAVAMICKDAGMNPIFDMDILNGRPYDKADFWKGLVAQHPDVVGHELTRIHFGTEEWDEWICITDKTVVASAYLLTIHMANRAQPIIEANYVKMSDPILGALSDPEWFNGSGAEKEARAYGAKLEKDGIPTGDIRIFPTKKGWGVKVRELAPDWEGLAAKKCRTTVFRRAGKLAIPRDHARIMNAMDKIDSRMEKVEKRVSAKAHVKSLADPYAEPETVDADLGDSGSSVVSETDRRRLMMEASRKGIDALGLKIMIARITDHPIEDAEKVTTSQITYEVMEKLFAELDELPEEDKEIVVEPESEPDGQQQRDVFEV